LETSEPVPERTESAHDHLKPPQPVGDVGDRTQARSTRENRKNVETLVRAVSSPRTSPVSPKNVEKLSQPAASVQEPFHSPENLFEAWSAQRVRFLFRKQRRAGWRSESTLQSHGSPPQTCWRRKEEFQTRLRQANHLGPRRKAPNQFEGRVNTRTRRKSANYRERAWKPRWKHR
jgi:hypothetical protein